MKCPRCNTVMGEPIKEIQGFIFKKEVYYFHCPRCHQRYSIKKVFVENWKCDYCDEEFNTKEEAEQHQQNYHNK